MRMILSYKQKMINWVAYNGDVKPTESISDARWGAMVKQIKREIFFNGKDVSS